MVEATLCCGMFFLARTWKLIRVDRRVVSSKYKTILYENLLEAAKDLRLRLNDHIPAGQQQHKQSYD